MMQNAALYARSFSIVICEESGVHILVRRQRRGNRRMSGLLNWSNP